MPARGFAVRSRAALDTVGPAKRPVCAERAGLGQAKAGDTRAEPGPRKHGLGLSQCWLRLAWRVRGEAPEGERAPLARVRGDVGGSNVADCSADNGWHAPFGAPPPSVFFLRVVVGITRARMRRENAHAHPPPRSGGGGPRTCAVEGACSEEVYLEAVPALMPRPLPPCFAWSPFPAARGRMSNGEHDDQNLSRRPAVHAGGAEFQH